MTHQKAAHVRALALVGPTGAGKTTLLEAMLLATGAVDRRPGGGAAEKVGDTSPEAKARGHSVEIGLAGFDFLGDHYSVVDCPGVREFSAEADAVLPAMDLAVIVADPEPGKAIQLQPIFQELERLNVPRALFINKIDQARGALDDLLKALAPMSAAPLVARQIPIAQGERITGYIDLALERAYVYRPGEPSRSQPIGDDLAQTEAEARFHMLEQLADYDDEMMEQLLSDITPARDAVFADLVAEMNAGQIVPVFFGSALNGFGVRRLLKALRHETAPPHQAAHRLGLDGPCAYVFKTVHAGQAGKLSHARLFGGAVADGADLTLPDGGSSRVGGLFAAQGAALRKLANAAPGDLVAFGKVEAAAAGQALSLDGRARTAAALVPRRAPLYAVAVAAENHKDDVRLSGALAKLVEEDPGLSVVHDPQGRQVLLTGQGEGHVRLALDRLKRRFGVEIATDKVRTPYQETVQKAVVQHSRHKKQTGGHGQFGDVTVEIRPLPRGQGVVFSQKVSGGTVPKQWIPAVEQGVRDALSCGPLGFPVTDVEVTLIDGAHHSVDSSEMAFRAAGRLAIEEGLRATGSIILEPVDRVEVVAPSSSLANVTAALSARRGQILGLSPRDGWPGWERIEAYLPRAERHDLISELRSLTQGLGAFEAGFDHMSELSGRSAAEIAQIHA